MVLANPTYPATTNVWLMFSWLGCLAEPQSKNEKWAWPTTQLDGWPEPYIYTVYDRIFGEFPAKNTVCKPYIYGSGKP